MTYRPITDIRRDRLRRLIAEEARGNQSEFAKLIGRSRAQVGFWLTDPSKPHAKQISNRLSREIERLFGKPEGWLDQEQAA